jgi:DNA-binding protein WhiA
MSFSGEVRDEIMEYYNKKRDPYIIKAERFGEYLTEAQYKNDLMKDFQDYFEISNLSEEEIKTVIKGIFLASGCITDPNKDYRFEATFKNKACAEYFMDMLALLDFTPKLVKRPKAGVYVVYFKESEQISYMLSLLEANKCMLNFEEIRVIKDVNNSKNRASNCEIANMTKSINSSLEQLNAIKIIRSRGKFSNLSEKLKYTASLREEYPTDTLEQIASRTEGKNKISKSGLKHRLDKLIDIAKELQ